MTAYVLRGDARHLPLPDGCVDLIVTSPPYFGLRSYTDACDRCGAEGRATRPDSHGVKVCPNGCEATGRKRCHYCGESMKWPSRKVSEPSSCTACNGTGQRHYPGQIGSEATPQEWLAALWECTAEWVRVLKPEGNLFVNLGDRYASRPGAGPNATAALHQGRNVTPLYGEGTPKSLLGLPWRYALGCTDRLGLILRAEIIWAKPNGLPESVTDRVRRSHEQLFHFTRQPRYYSAVDEIREPHITGARAGLTGGLLGGKYAQQRGDGAATAGVASINPLGKLPGSVWPIPSAPLQVPARLGVDHFAAFPPALVRPLILGWSPPGVCTACGHGRAPVVDREAIPHWKGGSIGTDALRGDMGGMKFGNGASRFNYGTSITGYACACTPYTDHPGTGEATRRRGYDPGPRGNNAQGTYGRHQAGEYERAGPWREYHFDRWAPPPTRPAVVLDPFAGTGTTLLVASAYGRVGVGTDLSADYCRLARWRVNDPGERARARDMPKPPPIPDGMEPLFTM